MCALAPTSLVFGVWDSRGGTGEKRPRLVRAIIRANGRDSLVGMAISSDLKGTLSLVLYAAGVGLARLSVWPAYALYAAVAVMWLIPDRRFTRGAGRR